MEVEFQTADELRLCRTWRLLLGWAMLGGLIAISGCSQLRMLTSSIDSEDPVHMMWELTRQDHIMATGYVNRINAIGAGTGRLADGREVPISETKIEITIVNYLDFRDLSDERRITVECLVVPEPYKSFKATLQTLPHEGSFYLFFLSKYRDQFQCAQSGFMSYFELVPPHPQPPKDVFVSTNEKLFYLLIGNPHFFSDRSDYWIHERLGFARLALTPDRFQQIVNWYITNTKTRKKFALCYSLNRNTEIGSQCYSEACRGTDLTPQDRLICGSHSSAAN